MVEPKGTGVTLLYVASILMALSWLTVLARLSVRRWLKPEAMGLDDYFMVIGLLFFIAEFFYAACTAPIKGSICVCLLRIADARRRFVWSLWAIIAATTIAPVIFIFVVANICHPITDLWGETTEGSCNMSLNSSVSYFFSAVSIFTDWAMAILPGVLLWNVQLKRRVKGSVTLILGLAAFASCATIVRLRFLTMYNDQTEFMLSTGQIGLWSVIEEGIGITAGSMPALRPVLSLPFFNRFSRSGSGGSGAGTLRSSANGLQGRRTHNGDTVGMNTLRSQRNPRSKNDVSGDGESQKYILKETQVSVTAEAYSGGDEWKRQQTLGWTNSENSD
ncbi:hypothetical protein VMCG_04725 [Cytospora schulzeri]|uniref:Rhodopsin domain-containing protein n=1 Tax=Cytospora schulzeri TaxID=448051 RepID=A0A423WNR1_9PEZI|nr:hypothetical protein VMCG_04725 [Valsa malicola]